MAYALSPVIIDYPSFSSFKLLAIEPFWNVVNLNININLLQNPLQYCKVISLQIIKINEKKKQVLSVLIYISFGVPFQ